MRIGGKPNFFDHQYIYIYIYITCYKYSLITRYSLFDKLRLMCFERRNVSLIPKYDNLTCFQEYRPISLYNHIYKIIANIFVRSVKGLLSKSICSENFGFFICRHIHEAIGDGARGSTFH
jgi:hypothetical protein